MQVSTAPLPCAPRPVTCCFREVQGGSDDPHPSPGRTAALGEFLRVGHGGDERGGELSAASALEEVHGDDELCVWLRRSESENAV
eukprot:316332-Hanusia_phi.AAC.3